MYAPGWAEFSEEEYRVQITPPRASSRLRAHKDQLASSTIDKK